MPDELSSEYLDHRVRLAQASAADDLLSRVGSGSRTQKPGTPAAPATLPEGEIEKEGSLPGRIAKDIGTGVIETPRALVKGVRDAYQNTIDIGKELGDWIEQTADLPVVFIDREGVRLVSNEEAQGRRLSDLANLPDLDAPESVTGGMVKGITQFLVGMKGAGKLTSVAGLPAGAYTTAALKGAIANFAVFDPHQNRLSNLIQQFPALQNPVTAYLASDSTDNAAEGRFKNSLEGLGLGLITDGFFKGVKLLREARAAKVAASADDAVKVAAGAPDLPEDAFRQIGDDALAPDAPILQTTKIPKSDLNVDPGKLGKGAEEPKVFINFARIDAPTDVKRAMQEIADASQEGIDSARRGVQTFEKIKLNAQQQDAWKVLKARRVGDPLNAEQSVAARQLWASSANKLTELAEAASQNPSEANLFAFRKMLAVHDAVQTEVIAARTETARALSSWRIPAGASTQRLAEITARLQETGGAEVARELATRVSALGKAGMYQEMTAVVEKTAYAKTRDAMLEGWINGLLSNPATHVANTASNTSVIALRMSERKVAASIASLLGDNNSVQAGEAMHQWYGVTEGYKDAFRFAAKTARTGETGYGLGKVELPREGAITSEAFRISSDSGLGRGVDLLGSVVRTPGRALAVEDEFFKTIGYRMELHAQALRQAISEVRAGGLPEEGLKGRIADIIANPPQNIRLAAADAAVYQTFNNAPGKLAQAIGRATANYPLLKIILPFTRTPANILTFTFERTPLAPLMSSFRQSIAAGGARRDLALAQMALGTGIMATTADLAMNGQITGRGPNEKGQRAALSRTGWQPYSVKVGDRWVAFNRLDPVGSLLGMSADIVDALRNMQHEAVDDPDTERLSVAAAIAVAGNLVNKTYLSGLASLFEAMSDPQQYGEGMVQRLAGSVVPAGAAAVNRQMDPYQREVYSMLDAIKARTPGLSDELTPRRNLWGEAQKWESGLGAGYDFFSPVYTKPNSKEPIDLEILEQGFNLTMPPKRTSFDGATVDLGQHPKVYSRYVELAGNELKHPAWGLGAKDLLNEIVSGKHPLSQIYEIKSDGPEGGKDLFVRDMIRDYRERARAQLLEEFPEIRAQVDVKREQQRELKMPTTARELAAN